MRRLILLVLLGLTACSTTPAQPTTIAEQPTQVATQPKATQPAATATQVAVEPSATVEVIRPTATPAALPSPTEGVLVVSEQLIIDLATGEQATWGPQVLDRSALFPWALSPSMTNIAVVWPTSQPKGAALWFVGTDGSNDHAVLDVYQTNQHPQAEAALKKTAPLWTATDEVIILSFHDNQPDLYAVHAQTEHVRRLTNTPELEFDLALDPTGTVLGYLSASVDGKTTNAWLQPITEAARSVGGEGIPQAGKGWIGDRFFFTALNPATFQPLVINAQVNGETASLPVWGEQIAIDGIPNHIIIALSGGDSPAAPTLIWDGADAVQALTTPQLTKIEVSPNRQLIYGCFSDHDAGRQQIFDLTGSVVWKGDSGCTNGSYWSPDSQWLALETSGLASQHGIGSLPPRLLDLQHLSNIVDLPLEGEAVGWVGNELVFSMSINHTEWQFYRWNPSSSASAQPVGKSVPSWYPAILQLPAQTTSIIPAPPIANPSNIPASQPSGTATQGSGTIVIPSSEDGSVIAFDLATSTSTYLVDPTKKGSEVKPPMALSPDQQTMAVLLHPSSLASVELWTVNLDGSNARKLKDVYASGVSKQYDPIYPQNPIDHAWGPLFWTPTNELIVVDLVNGQVDIQTIDPQTGIARPITNSPASEYNLVVNETETTIAYLSGKNVLEQPTDVRLWVQDLNGEPQELLTGNPLLQVPNLRILGWFGDRVIVQSATEHPEHHTIMSIGLDGTVNTVEYSHSITRVALTKQSILISVFNLDRNSSSPFITYQWDGRSEPETIIPEYSHKMYPAPNGEHFIGCEAPNQSGSEYWMFDRQGTQTTFGESQCLIDVRWSPDSQFAMVGDFPPTSDNDGLIVDRHGTVMNYLEDGAIPAGWIEGDALYFAPINNAWQLFRLTPGAEGRGSLLGTFDGVPDQPFYFEQ